MWEQELWSLLLSWSFKIKRVLKPIYFLCFSENTRDWLMGSSVMYWAVNILFTSARMKRKMALTWQLFVVPFVTIMVRWLSALSITAEPPTPGQLCSLRRELRCCGNKVRGSMLASQDWLLAWDEGKEDCIVATAAANRVRESLGNPAMFSITKITWENQQPTSLLIFHLETSVRFSSGFRELKVPKLFLMPQLTRRLPAANWLLGGKCYSYRAVPKNDLLSLLKQHSPPLPAACCGNESWPAVKIKPIFSAAAVNSISPLSSFLSPRPVPPFGVKMKAETCWEKQCSALFAG